jgi:hypothetical protein
MTSHTPTPRPHGAQPARRFGIRRPDGQWYINHPDGQRWGSAESARVWTMKQYADLALPALKAALGDDRSLPFDVEALAVAPLPVTATGLAASAYLPDFDALRLTTVGSRTMSIDVTQSPFEANADGATLWLTLTDGPLAIGLTASEARSLARWLIETVGTEDR